MPLVRAIETALAEDRAVQITNIGTPSDFVVERDSAAAAPFLDIFARLAASAPAEYIDAIDALVLQGVEMGANALSFRGAIDILTGDESLFRRLCPDLLRAIERRVAEGRDGASPLLAAYALEAMFRFALAGWVSKHRPLALMAEVDSDQDPLFVEHAAKLVGAAHGVWAEDDLLTVLQRLRHHQDAGGEACFELGLAGLKAGLEAASAEDAVARLEAADQLFLAAYLADEARSDAEAFSAVIAIIRGFFAGASVHDLTAPLEALDRAVSDRGGLLQTGKLPKWLSPRADLEIAWVRLMRKVLRLAEDLGKPSWLKAASVMDLVLDVYDADRTLAVGSGFTGMVRPRIEGAFVRERGLLAHLDDLLSDVGWVEGHGETARGLRHQIARLQSGAAPGKPQGEASHPLLESLLQIKLDPASGDVFLLDKAEAALAAQATKSEVANPVVQRILVAIRDGVKACPDYTGKVRDDFDALTLQVVLFCKDRQDAGLKTLGERGAYLRSLDATEFALQSDLRQWLVGNFLHGEVLAEVEDVATGRADLYVTMGSHRFVIELKRSHAAVDPGVASGFATQAASYQNTNVKLGMLGILEVVKRSGYPDALEDCLWTQMLPGPPAPPRRHLMVFKVPGALASPSSFSTSSRKPRSR